MSNTTDIPSPVSTDSMVNSTSAGGSAQAVHLSGWKSQQARFFRFMLAPSVILLTLITILPVIFLFATSFTSWDLSRPGSLKFVDVQNYVRVFTKDDRFWNSVVVQPSYGSPSSSRDRFGTWPRPSMPRRSKLPKSPSLSKPTTSS